MRPFSKYSRMAILKTARRPEEQNNEDCSNLSFSGEVVDVSILTDTGWTDVSIDGNSVTISVDNNDNGGWISQSPPQKEDRGAIVTLTQEESGNKINIGVHQSGKGYIERYALCGNNAITYPSEVRASEMFIDVEWSERREWKKDTGDGDWNPFEGESCKTYHKTVSIGSQNKEAYFVEKEFSFTSPRGVVVSGTVKQLRNMEQGGISEFSGLTISPNNIFWGCLPVDDSPSWAIPSNPEDEYIAANSSSISSLTMTFTPIDVLAWEVYNEDLPQKTPLSEVSVTYIRPKEPFPETIEELLSHEFALMLQQMSIYGDVSLEPSHDKVTRIASNIFLNMYVYGEYYYYPRHITRDFECSIIFKEKNSQGEYIQPTSGDRFDVNVHYAIICGSEYTGNTKPNPLVFYQQTTTSVETGATVDNSYTCTWPNNGTSSNSFNWKRRYFYSYPEGDNVEMKDSAVVFRGGSSATTANTKVANLYYRIESDEFTGSTQYDYEIEVRSTENSNMTISGETGTTKDSTETVDLGTNTWYPCQITESEINNKNYTRHIAFIITRKPK